MDRITKKQRSAVMASVRSKNTTPELEVRRLVHRLGFRYALHVRDLPGSPDLVFRPKKKAIFVHGCFWHYHQHCVNFRMPKSRLKFWRAKLEGNRLRDKKKQDELRKLEWHQLTVWECQISRQPKLKERILRFLSDS